MRRQQQERMARLIDIGFTIVEAQTLKVVPMNVPYMRDLINDRARLFRMAVTEGWGRQKYLQAIAQTYVARGWKEPHERLSKSNIFHMVKGYEADWRLTADPNDPYLLKQKRTHHGTRELLNREKVLEQKQKYRQSHSSQISEYRRKNRQKINEARRKREAFKRSQGL